MAKRVSVTKLNASTIDILNTIRQNASAEYQELVPKVEKTADVSKVGDVLMGYPALANQFVSSLMNRIALVLIKSSLFNNKYSELKKGYLEFGETIEEVFIEIAKAREFSAEKGASREFKRTLPDVRTAFHNLNWKVQYPITIENQTLRQAFQSAEGVTDMISKIIQSLYTANEYDEFLLFKYVIIKGVTSGKMKPIKVGDVSDLTGVAKVFKEYSNNLTFLRTDYNSEGVHTVTNKDDQYLFMTSKFDASYDIDVLAKAFNMDRAQFSGHQFIIDDFTSFDNERFSEIIENTDCIEEVTAEELALMKDVCGVLVDREWFQFYDNLLTMTEVQVTSGLYWNYNLHVWKTISISPFSNALVFVADDANTVLPNTITAKVTGIEDSEHAKIITIEAQLDDTLVGNVQHVYTKDLASRGVAVHRYGAYIIPGSDDGATITPEITLNGAVYDGSAITLEGLAVGDTVTFTKA